MSKKLFLSLGWLLTRCIGSFSINALFYVKEITGNTLKVFI